MTAYELYRQGRLDDAIEAALQGVKSAPTDIDGRLLLCDLLCFDNQLERADRQLDVVVQQDSGLAAGIGLYRQLIRAEIARKEVFESGRPPEFMNGVTDVLKLHVRASIALREGTASEAGDSCARRRSSVRPFGGECDGESFADLRDLDDLTASVSGSVDERRESTTGLAGSGSKSWSSGLPSFFAICCGARRK